MNVAASSGTADVRGYVIPISTVMSVAKAIQAGDSSGSIQLGYTAYLGVGLADGHRGATIAGVLDGGAAADAGLRPATRSLAGRRVDRHGQRSSAAPSPPTGPGDRVSITWTTRRAARVRDRHPRSGPRGLTPRHQKPDDVQPRSLALPLRRNGRLLAETGATGMARPCVNLRGPRTSSAFGSDVDLLGGCRWVRGMWGACWGCPWVSLR